MSHSNVSFAFSGGPGSAMPFFLIAIVVVVFVSAWIVMAGSRFVQGGVVEHPQRVPQLYGYTVCLVSLLVALASFTSIVKSTLTISNPLYASDPYWGGYEPSVTSFEAFKVTTERMQEMRPPGAPPVQQMGEAELRSRYEALRADRMARNSVAAQRNLITSILTFVIALALFAGHWKWLRRHSAPLPPAAAASLGREV